jgi:transcriptional regulator with XRE-family HTH domain/SOS-response transcriptional repressor LexA
MTQQEIADRLGLSSPYIAQMESGFKPPPPEAIVEKLAKIMRLQPDANLFRSAAEAERELQSLLKATRKAGYVLSGNKVCVPQDSVNYCMKIELDKLIGSIPRDASFHLDLTRAQTKHWDTASNGKSLNTPEDIHAWTLSALSEQPSVWLSFLGQIFDVLILTPDSRLLCRTPSSKRHSILNYAKDPGVFFQNLSLVIQDAGDKAAEQDLPNVVAPHENWEKIDNALGSDGEPIERITNRKEGGIREIPITRSIMPGTDYLQEQPGLGNLGLPNEWFANSKDYEACLVQSDSYVSLGVWPGCKAVYEIDGSAENEDLVVVSFQNRLYFRRYFDMGETIMLQSGGAMARPEQYKKGDRSIQIAGVVREMVARFRDVRSA